MAPKTEPVEQINANRKAFVLEPKARAINKTSGGIGKKEASAKDIANKNKGPYLELDHFKTQS